MALLALLPVLAILAPMALGQDTPAPEARPAPPPLAGLIVHGQREIPAAEPARFRTALAGLDAFESLDDGAGIAAVVRVMLEATSAPGTTIALLDIEDGAPLVAVATPGSLGEEGGREGNVRWWAADGLTHFLYHRGEAEAARTMASDANETLRTAFTDHRGEPAGGFELMLDLENLRRAWPQSLADGPARRVVAVTGLANARKVHVHIPERGAVRLAYSSRALPADEVSERMGPTPAVEGQVGVRWPAVFDAGLRTYAVALDDAPREAFAKQFQQWMSVNGGRMRGIIQAVEIAGKWTVERTEDGLRIEVTAPVRQGIETDRLIDAVKATLANSGFEVDGQRGQFTLPDAVASALGGNTLAIEVDDSGEVAVVRITVE